MITVKQFYVNDLRECCYILSDSTKECVIVDPGLSTEKERERVVKYISDNQLKPVKLLCTHGHFDHVMGNRFITDTYNIPTYIHKEDKELLKFTKDTSKLFSIDIENPSLDTVDIEDGDIISFGESTLTAISTPGHTWGSICFYAPAEKICLTGDTMFAGNCGRTDLPEGNNEAMCNSLVKKLATMEKGVSYMYFDGENVYCMPNYYMGKGIYKIDLQGNVSQIYDGSSLQLWITENEIYFVEQIGFDQINTNPQGTLSVMDKNGENKKEIVTNIKNNFFIANNKIYYTTQDRKMYSVNLDGTNPENITNGRKFTIAVGSNYLLYIDYANQESEHIIKLDTKEDSELGHFGVVYTSQGKTYLNARKRLDDGSIDQNYTLYEILDNGQVVELGNYANFGSKIKYVTD